ncbi:hypothetical protein A9B99_02575 [Mangrovibacter phragmitis]|uniref:Sulfatase N-terminal domain-containing protein n=1 Tax=Mangrovibacter phragmitis TaxID=1691903 RepID=A0A1B7L8C9_9ENTR|nr:sulfatase-like hydrolase/transferase [Mangrovibacter phragmitis]OAT78624.1 hypothetical protein A9B99_02575 [Mangrovibacter phragmitis]
MKKNVIFIHLESLNQAIYSHRHWFPCLNSIVPHAYRFNNFISSATSSFMAVSDLLHGDGDVLEHNNNLELNLTVKRKTPALFDYLKKNHYATAGIGYPKNWANFDKIWSERDCYYWDDSSHEMLNRAEKFIANKDQPFALYVWNLTSHLCYMDQHKYSGSNSFQRWQRGYESMDNTVGEIMRLLATHKQFDNTILVIFGDHGDDFWNHGYYGGFAHALEPFTSLVHTPAFIFDPSLKGQDINHLVSMLDLRKTTLQLLNIPDDTPASVPAWNAFTGDRKYCFSRNLFAAQTGSGSGNPLKKGYSITSDDLHLLHADGQYKMFAWQADSGNHFDLLPLLVKDGQGKVHYDYKTLGAGRNNGPHPHVVAFLGQDSEAFLTEQFQILKAELDTFIQGKNKLSSVQ